MPKIPANKTNKLPLIDEDLKNLRDSGLTDATIRSNLLRSERDRVKLAQMLRCRPEASQCNGALVFPYRDLDGQLNGFVRVRPHEPRMSKGKINKYEQPCRSRPRAYFPAASLVKLRDGKSPVHITEGEKKALALAQLGLAAIGIGGAWCGCKSGSEELIDDIASMSWRGRDVYIVFDFDEKAATRKHIDSAKRRLATALRAVSVKECYSVQIPAGPYGTKQGVDDFLLSHGRAEYEALSKEARPVEANDVHCIANASGRTDVANARRLVKRFGDRIRWVGTWDKWLVWDGHRWKIDQSRRIEALAKNTSDDLWSEIKEVAGKIETDTLKKMTAFATSSNQATGVRHMVAMAKSEEGLCIAVDELDTNQWLLNLANGTLNLKSGELQDPRQSDFLTKLSPVEFDRTATCPLWRTFLTTVFNERSDLIEYVQRLVGYSLTGSTQEHLLPFLYGDGANGKSTFTEILLKLMGPDYSMKAPPNLLMARDNEAHPTERADLFGKRLIACVETEAGRRFAESLVKELTGADSLRVRRMHEDFWEFTPTHHVWLAGNHKPIVRGDDHGIWRRIKLIPFDVTIPESHQDKQLPVKLAEELPGILNWALEGCLDWQRGGMREPRIVQAATERYSTEMDDLGAFLDEHCELNPEYVVRAAELFAQYKTSGGELTQQTFGRGLTRKGFVRQRTTGGAHAWKGLRIRAEH